jgi:hypothetical protein
MFCFVGCWLIVWVCVWALLLVVANYGCLGVGGLGCWLGWGCFVVGGGIVVVCYCFCRGVLRWFDGWLLVVVVFEVFGCFILLMWCLGFCCSGFWVKCLFYIFIFFDSRGFANKYKRNLII